MCGIGIHPRCLKRALMWQLAHENQICICETILAMQALSSGESVSLQYTDLSYAISTSLAGLRAPHLTWRA